MKSFKELYEQAQKDKNVRQITAEYVKWEKPGQFILGRLLSVNSVTSSLGGGEYNQYLVQTDKGLVKFSLGKSGDGEIGAVMKVDRVYMVEFLGQEDISGGRRVNRFNCVEVGFPDETPVDESDKLE